MKTTTTIRSSVVVLIACLVVFISLNCISLSTSAGNSFSYKISTFAGGKGEFKSPQKMAKLSNGDIIVSDYTDHTIKKISNGTVSTIAGTGVGGFSGDGGLAINAQLNKPFGIAVSLMGEIYIADSLNHRIRKIDMYGNISTIAGTGVNSFTGDGGLATACTLYNPMDVSFDAAGELYIADMYSHRVRKISTNGIINTVFGNGQSGHTGDGGMASNAAFGLIYGVKAFDNGEVYVSDSSNFKIRKVDINGNISTVAGSGVAAYNGDNILATSANLNNPTDVAMLPTGELLIADTDNYRVRLVLLNGTIITIAGNGSTSFSDSGDAEYVGLSLPTSVLITMDGILICESGNARIRLLTTRVVTCFGKSSENPFVCNGQGSCIANNVCSCGAGYEGPTCLPRDYYISTIAGGNGEFKSPQKMAMLSNGDIIVSDYTDHTIKKINFGSGTISRIAGTGVGGFSGDGGLAINAQLNKPFGVAVSLMGEIYIADSLNHRIRKIDMYGNISTIAGTGVNSFTGDGGLATACTLYNPMDVSFNAAGELYIADMYSHRVRKISTNGIINTVFGSGQSGHIGDGGMASNAAFGLIYGVKAFENGEVYVSDSSNFKVRKVDINGNISTVAGSGVAAYNGDNILATSANLNNPTDVAMLPTGELLIADTDNHRVRLVLLNGTIITIAGSSGGFSGDYGLARNAQLSQPTSVLVTIYGIAVCDSGNARIRLVTNSNVPPLCNGIAATDPSVCNGQGTCTGKDICKCNSGYNGTFCTSAQCIRPDIGINVPCRGYGNCSSGVCTCESGFYGQYCSIQAIVAGPTYSHPIMGLQLYTAISSLAAGGISNIEYTWSQVSGPTISNLATLVGALNRPTFTIPGKMDRLAFDNGLQSGNTYGFSLNAKVVTPSFTEYITATAAVVIQQNPTLTFILQDANTNQTISSGAAGTTVFKVTITGNSNPYSDSDFNYGFGFADAVGITILTPLSPYPATFTLPFIQGQSSIDLYVGTFGSKSVSVQKLTTISLSNPVSNLPASQAISTISNLISNNSSVGDLLGAASLLNTVSTGDSSQIATKIALRSNIISSLVNAIATADLGPALKALSSVTSNSSELTEASANNALDALIGSTKNSGFSRNSIQAMIGVASNTVLKTSNTKAKQFSSSIAGALTSSLSSGDIVSATSDNFDLSVLNGVSSFPMSNTSVTFPSNSRFLGCFFIPQENQFEFERCIQACYVYSKPAAPKKSRQVTYIPGSKVYDFVPLYANGTEVANSTVNGYIQITIPYTGNMNPICGIYSDSGVMYVDPTTITTKQGGSVICKTKNLRGNILLLSPITTSSSTTPKKSTQVNGSEAISRMCVYFTTLISMAVLLLL